MKREFIVERNGRAFVMYAGLLSLAHESGMTSIRTELVQAPCEGNKNVAICTATVVLQRNGTEHVYTGIGDAAENNVSAAMRSSLIRMAETRAKARALRDAVNVGVSAFEELNEAEGGETGERAIRSRGARQERSAPRLVSTEDSRANDTKPISDAQKNAITSLCRTRSMDADELAKDRFQAETLTTLTSAQAGELIRTLTVAARTRAAVAHA